MANVLIEEKTMTDIANAIRAKSGTVEKMKPAEFVDKIKNINSSNDDLIGCIANFNHTFFKANIDKNYVEIKYGKYFTGDMSSMFQYTTISKDGYIKFIGGTVQKVVANYTFANFYNLKTLDFRESDLEMQQGYAVQFTFSNSTLESILGTINYSKAGSFIKTFDCPKLKDIELLPNNIFKFISFEKCPLLTNESIQSIIDGLADLTGETAQTITFHPDVKNKLAEEQIASVTSKNWNIA